MLPVTKMTAAILVKQNSPLVVDQVELPSELYFGQVLVEMLSSGICGSQIGEIDGVKGEDRYLPHLLGHEGCGNVLAIGPGVTSIRPGDRVVLHWLKGTGLQAAAPAYKWQGRQLNAGAITTFNEYAIVSENRITKIPTDFDPDIACLFGCAITTGFGVINNNAQVKIGESIIVIGAGGVGLCVIEAASLVGAYPIVAVDILDQKLELAKKFGATHLINSSRQELAEGVKSALVDKGFDVAIENTGAVHLIEKACELVHQNGRIVLVGVPKKSEKVAINTFQFHVGKKISGSDGGNSSPSSDIPRYVKLNEAGRLHLGGLITEKCTLGDINLAIDRMRQGKVMGRCVVKLRQV